MSNNNYKAAVNADASSEEGTTPSKSQTKFLFCFDIETGFFIIGILEVLATIGQICNLGYSVRVGAACLIFFNLPLLTCWSLSQYHRKKGNFYMSYKFNTYFLSIFLIRTMLIIFGGFFFLMLTLGHDGTLDFMCDKYYGLDPDNELEFNDKIEECHTVMKVVAWIVYFPLIIF